MHKKIILSIALLCATGTYAHDAQEQIEYLSQDAYMVELYQRIVEFCKTQENPKNILVAIPLEMILVSGELPDALQDKIMTITDAITNGKDTGLDARATIKLVGQLIPYTQIIDNRIAASIKELQSLGVKTIALTSFMPEHAPAMLARMKALGLDFSKTALYKNEMPIEDEDGNQVALSKNGVVFMNDYFQSMVVLETMINNSPIEIEQLLIASPTPDEGADIN